MTNRLFPSQLDTETIFLVVREHWARLVLKLLVWLILALALVIFEKTENTKSVNFIAPGVQEFSPRFHSRETPPKVQYLRRNLSF